MKPGPATATVGPMGRARYSGDVHVRKTNWIAVLWVALFLVVLLGGMWVLGNTEAWSWLGDLLGRI
jgi:hypothetical protein